mgnify:FL=1|tara:strand:- start:8641 stop:9492 length:852 start_codon:yes stop_codon:yes gene_type:complete
MNQINKKDLLSINCNGELISLSTPKVMGILNITPDSFYDGGRYKDTKSILIQVEAFLDQGATFIDIGAYSSRPGAAFVSEEEELKRITPVIDLILKSFPDCKISIDSFRSKVIQKCVEAGAVISNDISSGKLDPLMFETIAKLKVPYIMMHMKGTPQNMQKHTEYEDLINDIYLYFSDRINRANEHGIQDLILDPGFGFSKTLEQNYKVLNKLKVFKNLNYPILSGLSRKSMIYKTLESTSGEALNGTTALNMLALINGANILRVHDVKEAMECIKLFNMYSK